MVHTSTGIYLHFISFDVHWYEESCNSSYSLYSPIIYCDRLLWLCYFSLCRTSSLPSPASSIYWAFDIYIKWGRKLYIVVAFSALLSLFLPRTYALSTSLVIPMFLLAYNYVFQAIKDLLVVKYSKKLFGFLGKHSLEIYLAQSFTTQYYLRYATEISIIAAWGITIFLTVAISVILYYSHTYFYKLLNQLFEQNENRNINIS